VSCSAEEQFWSWVNYYSGQTDKAIQAWASAYIDPLHSALQNTPFA
jgi:hypothetical protein